MRLVPVISVGNTIEHKDSPGFEMTVLEEKLCDGVKLDLHDGHKMFKVVDPDGAEDWLCERDVQKVGE